VMARQVKTMMRKQACEGSTSLPPIISMRMLSQFFFFIFLSPLLSRKDPASYPEDNAEHRPVLYKNGRSSGRSYSSEKHSLRNFFLPALQLLYQP